MRLRGFLFLVLLMPALSACNGDGTELDRVGAGFRGCGLSAPSPDVDISGVPSALLLSGVEVVSVGQRMGGLALRMNVPFGVTPALEKFRNAFQELGYRVIAQDNEGFEAELFLEGKEGLGSLRLLISNCPNVSQASINLFPPQGPRGVG